MKNKFLSVAASTAIVASALVFTGCGDSDSSSTPSSTPPAGNLAGQFVKGLWKGISYSTNSSVSGTTNTTGHFQFKTGDFVTLDLGLVKANITSPSSGGVVGITDSAAVQLAYANNTAVATADRATVLNNFLTAVLAVKGNVAAAETAGQDVTTMINNFKTIAGTSGNGIDLSKASAAFQADLDTKATAAGVTLAITPAAANALVSNLETEIAKQLVAAATAASEYTGANLNSTKLKNVAIVFTDGSALNLSNGPRTQNTTNMSTNSAGSYSSWNATGGKIVLGGTNTSDTGLTTVVLSGALGTGSTVKYIHTTGNVTTKTIDKVYANLWKFGVADRKYNTTFKMGTQTFYVNTTGTGAHDGVAYDGTAARSKGVLANLTIVGGDSFYSNGTGTNMGSNALANSTIAGVYNQTLVLNFNGSGALNDNQTNLTFDLDPTEAGNQGILSSIQMTISSLMTTIAQYVTNAATKVLTAMGLGA